MESKKYREIIKVLLENGWDSKQMITEGEAAIPLKTTLHAFRNQEKTKINYSFVFHKIKHSHLFILILWRKLMQKRPNCRSPSFKKIAIIPQRGYP